MKVVFMGTPDFAVGTLEEIVKQDMRWWQLSLSRTNQRAEERL